MEKRNTDKIMYVTFIVNIGRNDALYLVLVRCLIDLICEFYCSCKKERQKEQEEEQDHVLS